MEDAATLYDDFIDFIQSHDAAADGEPLEEFILEWLDHGDAVIESGGDFSTYLKGVILIIVRWLGDPSILDSKGTKREPAPMRRRACGVLGRHDSMCLDRAYFQATLMRRLVQRQ